MQVDFPLQRTGKLRAKGVFMTRQVKKRRGVGRPLQTLEGTEVQREAFLEAFRKTLNVTLSAQAAGVPRSTLYFWRARWDEFDNQWNEAKEKGVDFILEKYRELLEDQETPARERLAGYKWLLQVHAPDTYADKAAALGVRVDNTDGSTEVIIARVAPGVVDRLLEGSPSVNPEEELEEDYIEG